MPVNPFVPFVRNNTIYPGLFSGNNPICDGL